jgi:TPR repeat protein
MIAAIGSGYRPMGRRDAERQTARAQGEAMMADLEGLIAIGHATPEAMFELGMMHASGREVPVDLITAHKWFTLAAMKGHAEAARLRREVAVEMADAEIGQAQRAARDWLKAHPEPVAEPVMALRAAA